MRKIEKRMMILFFLVHIIGSSCLDVCVVPHSHCDAGWLKTFEKYYEDQVESIISESLGVLAEDPNKTFVWSETSFFERWFSLHGDKTCPKSPTGSSNSLLYEFLGQTWSEVVKNLVQRNQLEFVGPNTV
jgi:hypothetical protein